MSCDPATSSRSTARTGSRARSPATRATDDLLSIDLDLAHAMEGPVFVDGAEPGDLLEVELLAFAPDTFGFTCIIPGFGFLADLFPEPYLMAWDVGPRARHDGGAPGRPHPGRDLPRRDRRRAVARAACARSGVARTSCERAAAPSPTMRPGRPSLPRRPKGCGRSRRARTAATWTSAGSSRAAGSCFPSHVPGALLSVGDVHYAQGDGETNGTGLEIAAAVTLRVGLRKHPARLPRFPVYETPPERPRRWLATTGMPVTADGRNESMDLSLATRNAVLEMLDHLVLGARLDARGGVLPRQRRRRPPPLRDRRHPEPARVRAASPRYLRTMMAPATPPPPPTRFPPARARPRMTDRNETVRARRRQEALDSLELERRREEAFATRLEAALRDLEAWRADEAAFARMEPDDAALLRRIGFAVTQPTEAARGAA